MQFNSLDSIVKEALLNKGYPIHYYTRFMVYAIGCLRELNWDTLSTIKSRSIAVNGYNAIKLPCDFVDIIKLGVITGGHIAPWLQDDSLTLEFNKNEAGEKIPHEEGFMGNMNVSDITDYYPGVYTNSLGEYTGRAFNTGAGWTPARYKLMPSRGEIQLASMPQDGKIVLEYITDGMTCDASNMIHPYATEAIKLWIFWKHKENSKAYSGGEVQKAEDLYYNELRKTRARLSPLTKDDMISILRGSLDASINQ